MAYYIFTRAIRPPCEWELLETLSRSEVAQETFRGYQQIIGGRKVPKIALVEAENVRDGMMRLRGMNPGDGQQDQAAGSSCGGSSR